MFRSVLMSLFWATIPALAAAQVAELPTMAPKDAWVVEKGRIGTYQITKIDDQATVEVFGPEGEFLADCDTSWTDGFSIIQCTIADGKRFQSKWKGRQVRFEDLDTGDYYHAYFLPDPELEPEEPEVTIFTPENPAPPVSFEWAMEGTKTKEEVERDWLPYTGLLTQIMAEVELTLGVRAQKLAGVGPFAVEPPQEP